MTDGGPNPCIPELTARGARIDMSSLDMTIATLIQAERFVLGASSLSEAVFRLSHFHGVGWFYTFAKPEENLGRHWNCEPTDEYFRSIVILWSVKPEQMVFVKTNRCRRWMFVEDLEDLARQNSVGSNQTLAAHSFELSAVCDDRDGANNLSFWFDHNRGVHQNIELAIEWYSFAAYDGHPGAKMNY
jgi:TPR repeat protein